MWMLFKSIMFYQRSELQTCIEGWGDGDDPTDGLICPLEIKR